MQEEIREEVSFDEYINDKLVELDLLELGSEEYERASKSVQHLIEANTELCRARNDAEIRANELELKLGELELKSKEQKEQGLWNKVKVAGELVISAAGVILYEITVFKGFKFEETGSITSKTQKSLLSDGFKIFKRH